MDNLAKNKWKLMKKHGQKCTVTLKKLSNASIIISGNSSVLLNIIVYQNDIVKTIYDAYNEVSTLTKKDLMNYIYAEGYNIKSKFVTRGMVLDSYIHIIIKKIYNRKIQEG